MRKSRGTRLAARQVSMLKLINLEAGFPTVEQARQTMLRELEAARRAGYKGVKLIHGYGSSGAGGEIRLAVGRALQDLRKQGSVTEIIYGEDWSVSDPTTWSLIKRFPELKKDADLNRRNRGITIAWF
jgi:hypothetical protein